MITDLATHKKPFVTVSEIATYWQVHPSTIYRNIVKGLLHPHYLPSGSIRITTENARAYGKQK